MLDWNLEHPVELSQDGATWHTLKNSTDFKRGA